MNNLRLVLGGPGCGKTTRLLEIVERELAAGVRPHKIAFVTFTREAAHIAATRAAERFDLDAEEDLPYFRTIHSLAYRALGMTRDEVMDKRDWKAFGELVGEPISGYFDPAEAIGSEKLGDRMLRIIDLSATTMRGLQDVFRETDIDVDWFRLKRFDDAYTEYKTKIGKMDFNDMVARYIEDGDPLKVTVAVIDEAQDLTRAQWNAVQRAFSRAERVYVGGDDDQAIYRWAGADVDTFLGLGAPSEVLPRSHRLPRHIFNLSQRIVERIQHRYAKKFAASDREGIIRHVVRPDDIEPSDGTWLLLARNGYMLNALEAMVKGQGIVYTRRAGASVSPDHLAAMYLWERLRSGKVRDMSAGEVRSLAIACDVPRPQLRETARYALGELTGFPSIALPWFEALGGILPETRHYYVSCLRRGEKLNRPPRVRIETIHGVKGAEADHVVLMTDLSSRTAQSYARDPDSEHRVFYVGATRAKESLTIVAPQTDQSYGLSY